jgi:hypothetical protein
VHDVKAVLDRNGLLDGGHLVDGSSVPTMAAISFLNLGLTDEKSGHAVPSALKNVRAGRVSTVTPAASMRKKKVLVLAVESQSPLPPKEATLAMLPIVTPCVGRVPLSHQPQYIAQRGKEHSHKTMSDDEDVGENRSESGQYINDNTTSCERYDSIVVRDRGIATRSKHYWNLPGYFLFMVSLLVFCLTIPEHLPEKPKGRNVVAVKRGTFDGLLEEKDVLQSPIGYSIVGSEIVSLGAAVLVAAIFGSS